MSKFLTKDQVGCNWLNGHVTVIYFLITCSQTIDILTVVCLTPAHFLRKIIFFLTSKRVEDRMKFYYVCLCFLTFLESCLVYFKLKKKLTTRLWIKSCVDSSAIARGCTSKVLPSGPHHIREFLSGNDAETVR